MLQCTGSLLLKGSVVDLLGRRPGVDGAFSVRFLCFSPWKRGSAYACSAVSARAEPSSGIPALSPAVPGDPQGRSLSLAAPRAATSADTGPRRWAEDAEDGGLFPDHTTRCPSPRGPVTPTSASRGSPAPLRPRGWGGAAELGERPPPCLLALLGGRPSLCHDGCCPASHRQGALLPSSLRTGGLLGGKARESVGPP